MYLQSIVLVACLGVFAQGNPVVVHLDDGLFEGRTQENGDKNFTYYIFEGIPYAEPPVGDLRFEPPVPNKKWNGTLRNNPNTTSCIVGEGEGNEDCLYLNVFTPNLNASGLPVVAWVYGGGFTSGNRSIAYGNPEYLVEENVIFVNFNYRLGFFGFMSTNDLVVPGNMGLKDQILALKWIKKNIHKFGGDPNKVTLAGQSAGAASIAYLLQSNLTKGLFRGAIMDSGSSLCLWSLVRKPRDNAFKVGRSLGIYTTNSSVLVKGLKGASAVDLQKASSSTNFLELLVTNFLNGLEYAPVSEPEHDGAAFTGKSHQLLSEGKFHKVPILLGHNSMEAIVAVELEGLAKLALANYEIPSNLAPIDMNFKNGLDKTAAGIQIKSRYFGLSIALASSYKLAQFISDDQFNRPTRMAASLYAKNTPTYFYVFSYEGELGQSFNRTEAGVGHSEELSYLFKSNKAATAADNQTIRRMVTMWTNFVKQGNPTPTQNPLLGTTWETVSSNANFTYLDIGNQLQNKQNPNEAMYQFYSGLYNKYGVPPYGTY